MNHGPFRSGSWGKSKQAALTKLVSSITTETESFRVAVRRTALLVGTQVTCEAERVDGRSAFTELVEANGGDFAEVAQAERFAAGTADEPGIIPCPFNQSMLLGDQGDDRRDTP